MTTIQSRKVLSLSFNQQILFTQYYSRAGLAESGPVKQDLTDDSATFWQRFYIPECAQFFAILDIFRTQ